MAGLDAGHGVARDVLGLTVGGQAPAELEVGVLNETGCGLADRLKFRNPGKQGAVASASMARIAVKIRCVVSGCALPTSSPFAVL